MAVATSENNIADVVAAAVAGAVRGQADQDLMTTTRAPWRHQWPWPNYPFPPFPGPFNPNGQGGILESVSPQIATNARTRTGSAPGPSWFSSGAVDAALGLPRRAQPVPSSVRDHTILMQALMRNADQLSQILSRTPAEKKRDKHDFDPATRDDGAIAADVFTVLLGLNINSMTADAITRFLYWQRSFGNQARPVLPTASNKAVSAVLADVDDASDPREQADALDAHRAEHAATDLPLSVGLAIAAGILRDGAATIYNPKFRAAVGFPGRKKPSGIHEDLDVTTVQKADVGGAVAGAVTGGVLGVGGGILGVYVGAEVFGYLGGVAASAGAVAIGALF